MEIISNEGNDKLCLEKRNYDDEWSEEEECKLMKDFGERIEYLKKDDSGSQTMVTIYGTKYSRMHQVKLLEDSL